MNLPRHSALIGSLVLTLLLAGTLASPATATASEPVALSDERTLSRWAYVDSPTSVHVEPAADSAVLGRLRTRTHDGTPELVLALAELAIGSETWVEIRFKVRPNDRTGWVNRDDLGAFNEVTTFLNITRHKHRAILYDRGERVWSAPIGVGERRWPTPAGRFYVRERLIPRQRGGVYGVFAFGTSATSPTLTDWPGGGIIGIHGTNQPGLIPGRISHGCVRLRNRSISRLRRLMPLGTPILIR